MWKRLRFLEHTVDPAQLLVARCALLLNLHHFCLPQCNIVKGKGELVRELSLIVKCRERAANGPSGGSSDVTDDSGSLGSRVGARVSSSEQWPQCARHKGAFLPPEHAQPLAPAPLSPQTMVGKSSFVLEFPSVTLTVSQARDCMVLAQLRPVGFMPFFKKHSMPGGRWWQLVMFHMSRSVCPLDAQVVPFPVGWTGAERVLVLQITSPRDPRAGGTISSCSFLSLQTQK